MRTPDTKSARVDFRTTETNKDLISRAAALSGMSMSDFIAATLYEASVHIIERHRNVITVPREDFERFVEALDAGADPSPALVEDAALYAEGHIEDERYKW